ncbi:MULTISPECIES: hypothetical protein [Ralstonia]|jgi:hypothetical protein|uniref:DUF805 domain-containing protein n=9 Tax=Pseudomonadota TaxID=1224 RepID=A0A1C0XDC0_RALPI|nr:MULTISPECIES: hypothetical protein [Ralstonia]KRP34761.1 MAG: hypothetical protein ABS34_12440 [Opitutaceae bacterium BACL24 MAG-120322-bin51]MEA3269531.1 hypothetical protein [Pseudomonadota bacterium]NOZ18172.1 hypothetical protein [Betaproteobacteria bacterium]RFC01549.1 hypothetical protein DDJ70_32135 [Klebsiella michiganensis]RFP39914.1 hypothetical protein DDJ66_31520 [Klebsiella oxytoca]
MMVHGFDMAGYGLAHWITFAVMAVVLLYPIGRILMRIGLSPFWAILVLVPFFNLIGLWVLAFVEWPRQGSGRPG